MDFIKSQLARIVEMDFASTARQLSTSSGMLSIVAILLVLFLLLEHRRNLPLLWHFRFATFVARHIFFGKRLNHLQAQVVTKDRVTFADMDFNMHQNNAMYYAHLDWARAAWLCAVFKDNLAVYRSIRFANGGVTVWFLREMRYGQRYKVETKLVSTDGAKWSYLESRFVDPRKGSLFAVGLSRIVFKERSGKTIVPEDLFKRLGYGADLPIVQPGQAVVDQAASSPSPSPSPRSSDAGATPAALMARVLDLLEPGATASAATPRQGAGDAGGKKGR